MKSRSKDTVSLNEVGKTEIVRRNPERKLDNVIVVCLSAACCFGG